MYLKKKYRELISDFDNNTKLPTRFYQYVDKIKNEHRLIIKYKDYFICHSCKHEFKTKRFKVGDFHRCPNCHKKLLVKSSRLRNYNMNDMFAILERYKEYYIVRDFDIKTEYRNGTYKYHVCEYGRQIYDEYLNNLLEIYNNNISASISGKFINHSCFMDSNWKVNGSFYHSLGTHFMVYPYNLKNLLKDTKWKYCQIWDFAKNWDYFDPMNFLRQCSDYTEIFIKQKLYGLVASTISHFYICDLKELDYQLLKKHLKFIRKYQLNYDEIIVLSKINKENIRLIRKYSGNDFRNIFDELHIDLEKADKNIKHLESNFYEYMDYLSMCRFLEYDMKDKKILYPQGDIIEEHDKVLKLYNSIKDKQCSKKIKDRYNKIKGNSYQNKKYMIYPVKSQSELVSESKQQSNCVKTYAERIAKGECDIYFMRLVSKPKESLVTVEVKNNKVVQQRTKHNMDTTKEQRMFLSKWQDNILKMEG